MRRSSLLGSLAAAATLLLPLSTLASAPATGLATHDSRAVPADLTLVRTTHSLLGTHRWYVQTYRGVPVLGGFYAVHSSLEGTRVVDGRLPVGGLGSVAPGLDRAAAIRAAHGHGTARSARVGVLPGAHPTLVWEVGTDADRQVLVDAHSGRVLQVVDERRFADGSGKVFDPNPVVRLQDESLTDAADADGAVPASAYSTVTLHHLDGSGYLRGTAATVSGKGKYAKGLAFSAAESFLYTRADDRFEQVNAYFAVDTVQSYIQSLGFADVNNEPQDLLVDQSTQDNSWYSPAKDTITLGTGGVDDAEDQEVVWHEYGHAVQDAQVPGFGSTEEGGAIGEGFGDYLAATMSQASSPNTSVTPWVCVMDWDSTSYTSGVPHCIRRLDTGKTVADKTGEVHDDGEIWSQALWTINQALGRDVTNRIILEAQFGYAPDTDFAQAAQVTVDTARALYGASAASTVQAAFHARGIL